MPIELQNKPFCRVVPGNVFYRNGHIAVMLADYQALSLTWGAIITIEPNAPCNVMSSEKAASVIKRENDDIEHETGRLSAQLDALSQAAAERAFE